MNWTNPDDCCTQCTACHRRTCFEQRPSPREDEGVCADCCAARCGRLDAHEPHDFTVPIGSEPGRTTYHCPGEVVIEGGHLEVMA